MPAGKVKVNQIEPISRSPEVNPDVRKRNPRLETIFKGKGLHVVSIIVRLPILKIASTVSDATVNLQMDTCSLYLSPTQKRCTVLFQFLGYSNKSSPFQILSCNICEIVAFDSRYDLIYGQIAENCQHFPYLD